MLLLNYSFSRLDVLGKSFPVGESLLVGSHSISILEFLQRRSMLSSLL